MLTIDGLRKLKGRAVYHPLGAIRLSFRGNMVYHFYSDQSPMMSDENIHTHPYSFKSTVFKGGVRNIVYDYSEALNETGCKLIERACRSGSCTQTVYDNVDFHKVLTFETLEGNSYNINHAVMHKIELTAPKVITLLEKGPIECDALFILEKSIVWNDEELFNLKTEEECWEIIDYTLNG